MSEDESVNDTERDLEVILEGDQQDYAEHVEADNAANSENQENVNDGTKKKVKIKRVVRNPQPKLNEQTLKRSRGLTAVESYFERVKFKGRGYEEQDLNTLLKTYEYWCHRLFPKFPFDDCITRLEKLGTKRATQVQVKKIRMGLNFDEAENPILNEEVNDTGGFIDSYNDQLASFEPITESEPDISEEQLEKIKQNMEKAKRLREEKLRKMRENTQNNAEVYNQMDTQYSEYTESANITNDSQKIQQSNKMLTEDLLESEHQVDDEEDIDNILDYINEDTENINKRILQT